MAATVAAQSSGQTNAEGTRLVGSSPAVEIARDIVRRGLMISPLAVAFGALIGGVNGALSVAFGLAIVLVNFLLSAGSLGFAAKVSFNTMMFAALAGFAIRLGLVTVAVLAVKDQSWVDLVALGLTLVISHLGLLGWEARFVSGSLAFPALAPNDRPVVLASDPDAKLFQEQS